MLEFNGAPFSVGDVRTLDCQFGEKYYKQKKPLGKRLWLQGTRKLGCAAHFLSCIQIMQLYQVRMCLNGSYNVYVKKS